VADVGEDDFRLGVVCAGGRACFRHGEASIVACGPEPAWGENSVWTCHGEQPEDCSLGLFLDQGGIAANIASGVRGA
jgi:hypothetical protein